MQNNEDLEATVTPRNRIQLRPSVYCPERLRIMAPIGSPNSPKNRKINPPSNPGRQPHDAGPSVGRCPCSGSDHEEDCIYYGSVSERGKSPNGSEGSSLNVSSGSAEPSRSSKESSSTPGRNISEGSEPNVLFSDVQRESNFPLNRYVIIIVLLVGVLAYKFCDNGDQFPDKADRFQHLSDSIKDAMKDFPSQDKNLWKKFLYGIKTIISEDPTQPSVFLLLYHSENEKLTSKCLARVIGKGAAEFLGPASKEPLILEGENLKNSTLMEDYGWFLDKYKRELEEKHVMILYNLQDTPAVVAQSFHALCDRQNPLIEKAALFFTLHVEETLQNKKSADIADRTLRSLWERQLGEDISEPLITRITDTVLSVKSEDNLFMC